MNEVKEKSNIKHMIYVIRGRQVMLDSDLAKLYQCKNGTKTINLAVKRHINRFPERFMFRLTKEEYYEILRFQSETLELKQGKYSKYLPYAFTEQGVAMLATVLRTSVAEEISIAIMDAFVEMRRFIYSNRDMFTRVISMENNLQILNDKQSKNEERFELIFDELGKKEFKEQLFFDGQVYDAYSLLINIIREAKTKIIIIDNYLDKTILDVLTYKNDSIKVKLYVKDIKTKLDIDKFNLQYSNTSIEIIKTFHDRFIIIDDKILYHVGASLKDLGKKCFAISKMDKCYIKDILNKL